MAYQPGKFLFVEDRLYLGIPQGVLHLADPVCLMFVIPQNPPDDMLAPDYRQLHKQYYSKTFKYYEEEFSLTLLPIFPETDQLPETTKEQLLSAAWDYFVMQAFESQIDSFPNEEAFVVTVEDRPYMVEPSVDGGKSHYFVKIGNIVNIFSWNEKEQRLTARHSASSPGLLSKIAHAIESHFE